MLLDPIGMGSDTQSSKTESRKSTELIFLTSKMPTITTLCHGWEIQYTVTLPLNCSQKTSYPGGVGWGAVGWGGKCRHLCHKEEWQSKTDCKVKPNCHYLRKWPTLVLRCCSLGKVAMPLKALFLKGTKLPFQLPVVTAEYLAWLPLSPWVLSSKCCWLDSFIDHLCYLVCISHTFSWSNNPAPLGWILHCPWTSPRLPGDVF